MTTQTAALELRDVGIHVALLIVAPASSHCRAPPPSRGRRWPTPREIADAVTFLAEQGARAATHELQVTPLAER